MANLKIQRIDTSAPNAAKLLNALRRAPDEGADMVSPAQRKLTQAVFGEALSPAKVVERICHDVKAKGMSQVIHYTEQFDKVKLTPKTVRVSADELASAFAAADPAFLDNVRNIRDSIFQFQSGLLSQDALLCRSGYSEVQVRYRPLRRVGVCCPGGAAAYPSTLLMTVCPAQAADVKQIVVVMPPTPTGAGSPDMLAVCHLLGITEVYRIGGAQAVAAMAYGIDGLPKVDMIVGPGNIFVTLAKRHVYGQVAIDCLAGPSEIVVVGDDTSHPEYIAADMLAQAEHPGSAVLVTWSQNVIDEVEQFLVSKLETLARAEIARSSLNDYGAFVLVRDIDEAVSVVNDLATEHLHIQLRDPEGFADRIDNAGAIFLGQYTPVAIGDYASGPSHVLPTGGTARFASGLTANDFRRRTSIMEYTRNGLREISERVLLLSRKEGLTGHAESVTVRVAEHGATARPPRKAKPKK